MADFKNSRRYENLSRLSIEQLEELLRTAPFLSDSQETSEYYDAIEEVILSHRPGGFRISTALGRSSNKNTRLRKVVVSGFIRMRKGAI